MSSRMRLTAALREAIPTVMLIAVCFAFFLGIVRLSFPEGVSLRGIMRPDDGSTWSADGVPNLETDGIARRRPEAARLTQVVRKVKDKPADDIAWHDARSGMSLGTRHSIQTYEQSTATIAFDDETSLLLKPNSLIVLRSFDGEEDGSDRRASLIVFGGELRATIGGAGTGTRLAVETPRGTAHLASGPGKEPASFRLEVGSDSSTTIAVYAGAADVSLGERTVKLRANQAIEVDPHGSAVPRELPSPPAPIGPAPAQTVPFRGAAPDVRFRWEKADDDAPVRFVVARDPRLDDVVQEATTSTGEVSVGALEPGTYYWSVASVRDGIEGSFAPPRELTLRRDEEPPSLRVEWPEGVVQTKTCRLSGIAEPGAHVFVGDAPASSGPEGRFEIEVELSRGANNVVVEAVDDAGNSAYESRMIKALY